MKACRIRKIFRGILIFILSYLLIAWVLFSCNIIWMSPSYYEVESYDSLEVSIMTMEAYDEIVNEHRRPYCYSIKTKEGSVPILGVDHTNDPMHHHLDSIRARWEAASPSVSLVESRLGFLFSWLQDPIVKYGERGLTADLAKRSGSELYTWEPKRDSEIAYFLGKYSPKQLALFYVLRPYFSYSVGYREQQGEALMDKLINERTDYNGLKGQIESWKDIATMMKDDYPGFDWKQHKSSDGWPKGYLFDIWNDSNQFRDRHMIQCIKELVAQGEKVFVTMGASHAPRIENTLKHEILNQ